MSVSVIHVILSVLVFS